MITNRTAQLGTTNLRLTAPAKKNLFRQKLALIDTVPGKVQYGTVSSKPYRIFEIG